jgi:deoxyhypusine synthase
MKRKELRSGRTDGLSPLESLDLQKIDSFVDLLRSMGKTAFGGRSLGRAFDIWMTMAGDPDCKVVMTLSGAMTVAQQGAIVCEMIDRGLVNAVVSTGALICHGLTESIGGTHYVSPSAFDDRALYEKGYNRVYDTLEQELNLVEVEELVAEVLTDYQPEDGIWSSIRFCSAMGRRLNELDQGPGILRSAWLNQVPVFIPAFTDSEIGLDFYVWAMKQSRSVAERKGIKTTALLRAVPSFNPFLDLQEYAILVSRAKRLGIFTVGGGVPRNWAQQVAPLFDSVAARLGQNLGESRFTYGIRICPEPVHFGGLSGCTYSEGVSWGKFLPPEEGGHFAEVFADATLVLPLLMKAVFEGLDKDFGR